MEDGWFSCLELGPATTLSFSSIRKRHSKEMCWIQPLPSNWEGTWEIQRDMKWKFLKKIKKEINVVLWQKYFTRYEFVIVFAGCAVICDWSCWLIFFLCRCTLWRVLVFFPIHVCSIHQVASEVAHDFEFTIAIRYKPLIPTLKIAFHITNYSQCLHHLRSPKILFFPSFLFFS